MTLPAPAGPHRCAVWITDDEGFRGSGFLAGPGGLVVTAAHVVSGTSGLRVGTGAVGHPVAACRAEPAERGSGDFYPFPDLAVLTVPGLAGAPVAALASAEAADGAVLRALGYSTLTPTPGIQPDSLEMRVAGVSAQFRRVLGDGVKGGFSGSMLVGTDGLVAGVLKASRSYELDHGGWYVPVAAVRDFLGLPVVEVAVAPPPEPVAVSQIVDALMEFPLLRRADGRYQLLTALDERLAATFSADVDEAGGARMHLRSLVRTCRHYRDPRAANVALGAAMGELAPHDQALPGLLTLLELLAG